MAIPIVIVIDALYLIFITKRTKKISITNLNKIVDIRGARLRRLFFHKARNSIE